MKDSLILIEAFFNYDDVDKTLQSLVGDCSAYKTYEDAPYDIIILENPSKYTTNMKKIIDKYTIFIKAHYLANKNVEGHVIHYFINNYRHIINDYKYIAITEGDVILDKNAFEEAYTLLNKYVNVGNVSIDLSLCNLNIPPLPQSAKDWVPVGQDAGDYLIGPTGFQFILFRTNHLLDFVEMLNQKRFINGIALGERNFHGISDTNLMEYNQFKKSPWIRTKYNKLIHIGWEHYKDINDEYWNYKTQLINSGQLRINVDNNSITLQKIL